ncbi:MAG: hypothetical protein AAF497_23010, partial [Planctomycetota bacterium]
MLSELSTAVILVHPNIHYIASSPLGFANRAACRLLSTETIEDGNWCLEAIVGQITSFVLANQLEHAIKQGKVVEGLTGWHTRPNELHYLSGRPLENDSGYAIWFRRIDSNHKLPIPWEEGWRALESTKQDFNYAAEVDVSGGLRIIWCDEALTRLIGVQPGDGHWTDAWHHALGAETKHRLQQRNRRLLDGFPGEVIYRLDNSDQTSWTLCDHAVPIRSDATNEVIGAVASLIRVDNSSTLAEEHFPYVNVNHSDSAVRDIKVK